jgi:hypothetical protein
VNPQRLAELQRQRDLVREHLAWLEREIAREHGATPPAPVVSVSVHAASTAATSPAPLPEIPRPDPVGAAAETRRGCLFLFIAALSLLGLALFAIYFLHYRDRPLF